MRARSRGSYAAFPLPGRLCPSSPDGTPDTAGCRPPPEARRTQPFPPNGLPSAPSEHHRARGRPPGASGDGPIPPRGGAVTGSSETAARDDLSTPGRRGDPELAAPAPAPSVCRDTPTRAQARTRLYRAGQLVAEGFPAVDISDHLAEPDNVVWWSLCSPEHDALAVISEEFALDPLAVEDAIQVRERPKLDRYPSHLFLNTYAAYFDVHTGKLATSEA